MKYLHRGPYLSDLHWRQALISEFLSLISVIGHIITTRPLCFLINDHLSFAVCSLIMLLGKPPQFQCLYTIKTKSENKACLFVVAIREVYVVVNSRASLIGA